MLKEIMTKEEIHAFGIDVVVKYMKNEGYEIIDFNNNLNQFPQIIAKQGTNMIFVIVATDCYPNNGRIDEKLHFRVLDHSQKQNALAYFASVGICNADGNNEQEMGIPYRGNGFYVNFRGLLLMTSSDKVKFFGEDGKIHDYSEVK